MVVMVVEVGRAFKEAGFKILATGNTCALLNEVYQGHHGLAPGHEFTVTVFSEDVGVDISRIALIWDQSQTRCK